ncbi:hypothetical protein [Bacillus pseudomycoides]|uniref:hypothetical protein n=1 Tax=Bacillus pseudomycoides TaxID=64104 RepID=UPI001FB38A71|nr:hypothetical protein [Bacillus pseudomycoides]
MEESEYNKHERGRKKITRDNIVEIINELELKKLMERDKENEVSSKIIRDVMLKKLWGYYNFLSNNVVNIIAKENKHKVMYSTYYWYTKYKKIF